MTDSDNSCHTTVCDFPTLTRPRPTAIARRPAWRAINSSGRWTVVGDLAGQSVTMDVNPYRSNIVSDAGIARRVAAILDQNQRREAAFRMLLGACQYFEEARGKGLDAGADLIQFAAMARESIR